jgi:hypothetical protein
MGERKGNAINCIQFYERLVQKESAVNFDRF